MYRSPGLANAAWFAGLGLPLTPSDRRDAAAYLAALGHDELPLHAVMGWRKAARIAHDPGWDTQWWTREEAERAHLMARAGARLSQAALLERLSAATGLAAEVIHAAAADAAQRDGGVDAALVRAASGAASMALHTAALACLAGEGAGHLFMRKYRLFAFGRWPLGIVGNAFFLF